MEKSTEKEPSSWKVGPAGSPCALLIQLDPCHVY